MNEKETEVIKKLEKILEGNNGNEITMNEFKTTVFLIKKQQKIIDKMAQKIVKLDNSDQYCLGKKRICPHNKPTFNKCKECVKKYYEKRNRK